MKGDTVKTVILFSVVALVFCGLAAGGIHFIKARNSSYAMTQGPKTDSTKQDNTQSTSSSSDNQASQTQSKVEEPQSAVNAPVQAASADTSSVVAETGPQSMPATGSGLGDFIFTIALMMLATFFGGQLLRAKNNYRRLYSAD